MTTTIRAAVVDQDHVVDVLERDLFVGLAERGLGVVGRHDHDDFLAEDHRRTP
jgi:hypothetical protein